MVQMDNMPNATLTKLVIYIHTDIEQSVVLTVLQHSVDRLLCQVQLQIFSTEFYSL